MTSFLPSIPYPPPLASDGYWGPVTSTLDWCEENYYLTHYCAEIINTVTNGVMVFLAYRGFRNCIQEGHDKIFLLSWMTNMMIALGSICFHSSLIWNLCSTYLLMKMITTDSMQLVDEISMIWNSSVLVFTIFSFKRSLPIQIFIGTAVSALALTITFYYFYLGDPVFHQVAFTLLTLLIILHGVCNIEYTLQPRWRKVIKSMQGNPERWTNGHGGVVRAKADFEEQQRKDKEDMKLLKLTYQLMGTGILFAVAGFSIWSLDRIFCGTLRSWRREIGMPWGFLLEGHAWWHILTGIAAYDQIVCTIWMRYALYGRRDEVELIWPGLFTSFPKVIKKENLGKVKEI